MRRPILAILVPVLLAGCGLWSDDEDGPSACDPILGCDPGRDIQIRLANAGDQPAHLFHGRETFPCCRVEAGASRTVTQANVGVGSFISVEAGRDGVIIVGHTCVVTRAQREANIVVATFVGNGWGCG